jgi:RNA polymerase sigma-70 factor (ECF subfamily)
VAHHYEPLFRFALSLTRSEADSRDLTQQAFYVWATKGYQLRDYSKAKAWLFTTLHRAFLASRRINTRFRHYAMEDVPIHDLPACAPDFVNAVDSPQVLAALAKVDAVYQSALALFYLEDWSYREIAQILEVPVGTVKSRIARGIGQLRQLVGFSASERSIASVATRANEKTPEYNRVAGETGSPERPSQSVPVSNYSPEPFPG